MVPEAPLERNETGLAPAAEGWFVLNARDARWSWDGRSACSEFEGEYEFPQLGIYLRVPRAQAHAEAPTGELTPYHDGWLPG